MDPLLQIMKVLHVIGFVFMSIPLFNLIVVNEAHKMAARYYGSKLEKPKRYQVGEQLRGITRHFSGANVIVSRQERATGRSRRRSRCGSQRFPTPKPKAS